MGGGNNPDEASVLDKNRTRVRKDERASSTGVWFGGGWAKSWGEEVRQIILRNWRCTGRARRATVRFCSLPAWLYMYTLLDNAMICCLSLLSSLPANEFNYYSSCLRCEYHAWYTDEYAHSICMTARDPSQSPITPSHHLQRHLNTTVTALTSILLAARASDSLCLRARADHQRQTEQTRQVVRNKTAPLKSTWPSISLPCFTCKHFNKFVPVPSCCIGDYHHRIVERTLR